MSRRIALALVLMELAAGCSDYGIFGRKGARGPESWADGDGTDTASADDGSDDTGRATTQIDFPETDASFNVAYQYGAFGGSQGRCQVEIAFFQPTTDDGSGGSSGQSISMPSAPGECAFTSFDLDGTVADGSMNIRGTWTAGDSLTLDDGATIPLPKVPHDDGTLTYALADCRHDTFPFARAFDVVAPGGDGGLPGFTLEAAVGVGPDLVRVLPDDAHLDQGILDQSVSEDMEWAWEYASDPPETAEGPMVSQEIFLLRNNRRSDNATLEAVACYPAATGELVVPVDMMSQLTPDPGDGSLYASAQVDVYWDGGDVQTQWGQLVKVRSLITLSGELRLAP